MSPTDESADIRVLRLHVEKLLEYRGTLGEALQAYSAEMPAGRTRRELQRLAIDLQGDATVDQLCQRGGPSEAWLPLLAAGAAIGHPMRYLPELFAEASEANRHWRQLAFAYVYPALVALLAIVAFVFLSVTLVPMFEQILNDFQLELPALTQLILAASRLIRFQTVALTAAIAAGVLAIVWGSRLLITNQTADLSLGWLTAGSAGKVAGAAAFTRRLAELLEAGIPTSDALRLAGGSSLHAGLRGGAMQLARHLEQGGGRVGQSLGAERLPSALVAALDVETATQSARVALLKQLADSYGQRAADRFAGSFGMTGPLAIVGVGLVVGLVVLAMFLPLVSLVNGLSG